MFASLRPSSSCLESARRRQASARPVGASGRARGIDRRFRARLEQVTGAVRRLEATEEAVAPVQERIEDEGDGMAALAERADSVAARVEALLASLGQPPGVVGWVAQRTNLERRDQAAAEALANVERFYAGEPPAFRQAVEASGLDPWGGKKDA